MTNLQKPHDNPTASMGSGAERSGDGPSYGSNCEAFGTCVAIQSSRTDIERAAQGS